MAQAKQWIVYRKPDGEVDAVASDFTTDPYHDQIQELNDEHNVVLGMPYCVDKQSAINWVEGF